VVTLACSSDRGLCGSIHSSVAKAVKRLARQRPDTRIVVLGEKAKSQIAREARRAIGLHFASVGRTVPTITDALSIWNTLRHGLPPNGTEDPLAPRVLIVYNRFLSVIAFETVVVPLSPLVAKIAAAAHSSHEGITALRDDLVEYLAVCRLFCALVEGHVAELSSKRSAMENATKNSQEMVAALTMKYNRTRQSVITNELVDIIVGASAL